MIGQRQDGNRIEGAMEPKAIVELLRKSALFGSLPVPAACGACNSTPTR
jgi:hypothetical protein